MTPDDDRITMSGASEIETQDVPESLLPAQDSTMADSKREDPLIGALLSGQYRILSRVGGGGMGFVYKAWQESMQRPVAIKMLKAEFLAEASSLQRFQREAVAASRLNHPNIVTLHDFRATSEGQIYLVMDYLEGMSLAEIIKQEGQIDIDRFVTIFMQVADALEHAHRRGIIHRDLKPANIVLTNTKDREDQVKVVDFGVAKIIAGEGANAHRLTQTGEIFGSPMYMSPEQCMGETLDPRSDIYALGIAMYESLTGCVAIRGKDVFETILKHRNEMPAPFVKVRPDLNLPERLESIVFKALKKDPAERYQQMSEVKRDLELAVARVSNIRPAGVSNTRPAQIPKTQALSTATSWPSKLRAAMLIAIMAMVLVAAVLTISWLLSDKSDQATKAGSQRKAPASSRLQP